MSRLIETVRRLEGADEQEALVTRPLVRTILIVTLVAVVAIAISEGIVGGRTHILIALIPVAVLMVASLYLVHRGILWPARLLIPITILSVLTYLIAVGGGIHDVSMLAYAAVLILASLMLGQNAVLIVGSLVIVSVAVIAALEMNGTIVNEGSFITIWDEVVLISILVLVIAGLLRLTIGRMSEGLRRARQSEQSQIEANRALRELQAGLEERVAERTHELARRTDYLDATAQIAREAATTLDLQALLPRIVHLISSRLGYYHVAIFLSQEHSDGLWLTLQAASSEGGRRMLAREHRVRVEEQSAVGRAAHRRATQIVQDTEELSLFLPQPELPDTRSQIALPLAARGEILGVLDVQSAAPHAFLPQDVKPLEALADQLALAISNVRLFQQVEQSLEAERRAYGELSRQAWSELVRQSQHLVYHGQGGIVSVLPREDALPAGDDLPTRKVPILVRGQLIATLQARKPNPGDAWTSDEAEIIDVLAEQLGVALDSARLYQDSQRRAAQERLVGDVTARMRETLDMDTVLRTAIREIGQSLDLAEVEVRMAAAPNPATGHTRHAASGAGNGDGVEGVL